MRHTRRDDRPLPRYRTAAPLAAALLASAALAACAIEPAPQGTGGTPQEVARTAAVEAGLTPTRVVVNKDEVETANGRERLQGYVAWLDVAECTEGKVIIRLAPTLYVRNITGVYGCTVPGSG
ncbi:MAG: hypothetical protein RID91_03335 [Azospirillaceae bacterium]